MIDFQVLKVGQDIEVERPPNDIMCKEALTDLEAAWRDAWVAQEKAKIRTHNNYLKRESLPTRRRYG